MRKLSTAAIALTILWFGPSCRGGIRSVDLYTPGSFQELGEITSDGNGGRQSLVRALEPDDRPGSHKFFTDYLTQDPPSTVAQDQVFLSAGQPLVLTLPQLAATSFWSEKSVSHVVTGTQIKVEARQHNLGYSTDVYFPPNELIYGIGSFPSGDYRLTVDFVTTHALIPGEPAVTTGFIDFTVQPVPEPTTGVLAAIAVCLAGFISPGRQVC